MTDKNLSMAMMPSAVMVALIVLGAFFGAAFTKQSWKGVAGSGVAIVALVRIFVRPAALVGPDRDVAEFKQRDRIRRDS